MNEFQLIYKYFSGWKDTAADPVLGIGDDAAIIQLEPGEELVVAADTLVEGRHFPYGANPALIASRAIRVNLSDMAAMAADPRYYTLCLTLPESDAEWLEGFAERLRRESAEFGCSLIGGDTTRGELCISLQMLGVVETDKAVKRSGAKVGDHIWVTGSLGDAAGYTLLNFPNNSGYQALAERFWSPQPRLGFAKAAAALMSSCIDISDGLVADLGHICSSSQVGANLQLERIPISEQLQNSLPEQADQLALSGGDDYELCFTAAANLDSQLQEIAKQQNLPITRVGNIVAGTDVNCLDQRGVALSIEQEGYSHF